MENCRRILRPIDITVVPTVSVIIITPEIFIKNREMETLEFRLTRAERVKYSNIVGNEIVYLQNGSGGTNYQLIDNAGNVFYADKLLLGFCYRLRFGNNGLPTGVPHWINLNTPCCSRAFDPSNAVIGTPDTAGLEA